MTLRDRSAPWGVHRPLKEAENNDKDTTRSFGKTQGEKSAKCYTGPDSGQVLADVTWVSSHSGVLR